MKRLITALALLAVVCAPAALAKSPARRSVAEPAAESTRLPLRRVILYSNGVAYFERRGTVSGHAEISLPFKQSQVDDVLKSMVVLDLGQGRVGSVSYNSSAPVSSRLSEIPFSIDAKSDGGAGGGLAGVLEQLQGARVAVSAGARTVTGAVLTVEERRTQIDATKPPVITKSLVVASDTGEVVSFDLEEVRSVRLLDDGARHDVTEFADASAAARRRDAKTIVVTSDGGPSREMTVSYMLAAPIWKTSYRVVFDDEGKPFFQGWAIVDNTGDEDWNGVELSLVSGSPVSFIQPLQQPVYRHRPVVPIPESLELDPQEYEPETGEATGAGYGTGTGAAGETVTVTAGESVSTTVGARRSANLPLNSRNALALTTLIASGATGVAAAASGTDVGDLFEYAVDHPVTVPRNRSALIPILQAQLSGERVSVYNESARADRPYGGMRLENTSALTLEAGPVTVYDGNAYAGEALMPRLKPGETRFIAFALDLATLVTTKSEPGRKPVYLVRAVNGVVETHHYDLTNKTYTIKNQTARARAVYVEHPRSDGWDLLDDAPKPEEVTPSFYRFRVDLGPNETKTLVVGERSDVVDQFQLSSLTRDTLAFFVANGYVDEPTRAALAHIVDLRDQLVAAEQRMRALDSEAQTIAQDQARLRENIKALGSTPEARSLIARYVAKADQQETRLDQLAAERKAAEADRTRLQAEIVTATRNISIDRKIQ